MEKPKAEQNDWASDEDDDWDEWIDAEDNEITTTTTTSNSNSGTQQTTSDINKWEIKQKSVEEEQSPREEPTSRTASWASMLRPFGGVVSTITNSVSQGINQVIGVPDPEELARINSIEEKAKKKENQEQSTEHSAPIFSMDLVSGVTTLGSKVLNTGLDTLEGIGKKTMNILQENDPLLMSKRKMLGLEADKPNLSAVLQEAKKDADQLEHTLKQLQVEKSQKALRFETLFENNCGLMHLEALEILSKESNLKLKKLLDAISGQALHELRETINEVEELMQLEDLECESDGNFTAVELSELFAAAIEDAALDISFEDIINIWSETLIWLEKTNENKEIAVEEIFSKCLNLQAQVCALEINKLHKIGEILLVKEHHSTASEVDAVVQLCKQFNLLLNGLTNRFASILPSNEDGKKNSNALFSEMLLATQQIEKAFKLFLPVLQMGAV